MDVLLSNQVFRVRDLFSDKDLRVYTIFVLTFVDKPFHNDGIGIFPSISFCAQFVLLLRRIYFFFAPVIGIS